MNEYRKANDKKYLANVSRRLKQIANKSTDEKLKSDLWGYSKELLDISSRIHTNETEIGKLIQS